MPTFSQIQNQFNSAKARNLIGPDESLADFAKKALEFTGDPSYKSVAEGGAIGNFVRGASADLTNMVNAGPVDEWLGAGTEWLGGKFGVDPEAARSVGESLPRMAVDYLPMAVGAALGPVTLGASLPIGMAATSGLSAANAYEQSGSLADAAIGGVAPYLGSKLSEVGGRAALNLVPKSQILQRLGFTGGTQVSGRALSAAEQAGLVANRGLTETVAKATTKSFTELDKPLDKVLHYLGGEALANVGFTGLDIAQQGTDAVFNRNYLFANLVSNIPFAAADLAGSFGNRPVGEIKYDLPEAERVYLSPGEERALLAASKFADLKSPEAVREYRQKYGLDMADIAIRSNELSAALNRKELGLKEAEDTFTSKWNNYVQSSPEAQQAGFKPVQQGGAFGKERLNIKELMGQEGLPIEGQKIVDEYRMKRTSLQKEVNGTIARLGRPVNTVDSLKLGVQQLGLDEFLNTPIEQRDYVKALEGTMMSLDGADLIRDIHRVQAGLEPVRGDLYQNYVDLFAGKDVEFTPDKSMELLVAASLARGQTPKFTVAKEKVKQAVEEGQTSDVVAKKAVEGVIEENKVSVQPFRQPVIPDETLSGLTDLGQGSSADLRRGMVMRPGVQQQFIPDQVESGLTEKPPVSPADLISGLSKREAKPQVEQTAVEKLIASIPAKWPDDVKAIAEEFYRTGDDTKVKNLGIDPTSDVRKKAMYRALKEADPTYEARLKAWEQNNAKADRERRKVLNKLPVHTEKIEPELVSAVDQYKINQEKLPMDFFRAEDWSRLKDQDGNEYLIPVPEGEFQQVEQFARSLMSKLVSPEMLPESSKELVELAKLFNNPEVAYAELGKMVKGKSDVQFAQDVDKTYFDAIEAKDSMKAKNLWEELLSKTGFTRKLYTAQAAGSLENFNFNLVGQNEKGLAALGPGIYLLDQKPMTTHVYGKRGPVHDVVLHDSAFIIDIFSKDQAHWAEARSRLDKAAAEVGFNSYTEIPHTTSGLKDGRGPVGAFVKLLGREKARELMLRHGIHGSKEELPSGAYEYAIYDPRVIKSAEAVVKDTEGNIIAPSQRLNLNSKDFRFARASAGAFDFGMREVQNGKLIRPGKPPLGTKDGWMTELEFRVNGGEFGPLQKDEVAFYKQLVPEAFANDKVHLQKLWDGLGKAGEQVKVVTYGQEARVSESKQELDKLTHDWWDGLPAATRVRLNRYGQMFNRPEVTDFATVKEGLIDEFGAVEGEKAFRLLELRAKVANEPKDSGPRATSYYNQISPFDTKKFPVLRVDVVLPLSKKTQDAIDRGVDSLGRESEIKWQQDNLHENLPNTLGWAMVQVVPDPKTGEKVMFVGEAQSRWAQSVRDKAKANKEVRIEPNVNGGFDVVDSRGWRSPYATLESAQERVDSLTGADSSHPLLPIHQNLILKSVIKEAQKQGITKIAISDGETAMMTEGHDKSPETVYPNKPAEIKELKGWKWTEQKGQYPIAHFKLTGRIYWPKDAPPLLEVLFGRNEQKADEKFFAENPEIKGNFYISKSGQEVIYKSVSELPKELRQLPEIKVLFGEQRAPQEGGMRLAYDTTMPSIMSKLVGSPMTTLYRYETDWNALPLPEPLKSIVNQTTKPYRTSQLGRGVYYSRNRETWKNYRGDGGRANFPVEQLSIILDNPTLRNRFGISSKEADLASGRIQEKGFSQKSIQSTLKNRIDNELDKIIFKHAQTGPRLLKTIEVAEAEISKQQDYHAAQDDKSNVVEFLGDDEVIIRDPNKLQTQGEMRDFGVHKNQQEFAVTPDQILADPTLGVRATETVNKGSPVFRNPDGSPKTNVTARVYDISNPSPRTDTLFAQNQGRVYGAASYKAKQILINSKAFQGLRASDRAVFVFAHEQSHISFAKALEGKYGPQAKIQAEKVLAWVNAADPQAKKNVEDVLKELHLDKELAQMDGIRDVLNNPDPQEWLANVMGMYGFGAVKAKAPKQAFAMLPKPIRQFAEWMVQHLQNLSKGAMTWLKLSGKDYEGAKKAKELFDSIRRSYRQAEWEAAQAERFLDIEPTSMFDRGEEYAFAKSGEKMGEVGEQPFKDAPKRWIGGMWNKVIQPMHTLGNLYEGLKAPVMAVFNAHSDTENAIGDVFKVVVGELGADEKVRMTNEAFKRVMGSEQLNKLFNQIQVRSQVVRKRMIKLNDQNTGEVLDFEALSPELRGRLQQFNPEAQKALATMIAQAERANILHQEKILEAEWQGSVHDFATLLASKVSFNKQDYGKAVEISKGVLNDLKMANETRSEFDQQRFMAQAQSKLAQLEESDQVSASVQAQEIFKRYDDLKKYYDDHPTWMSFRRYGKIKQRIEKNGEFDVIDADTEKELAETLKFYFDQGWKRVGERQVVEKKLQGQYYLNDALLKIMQDREGQFKTMLQEANIPEEEKARLMAVPSATSAMISEINSRELYRPTKGRKLTGDLERFDWWEQFQRYTPAALAAAQRRALGAKINYWMQNPELNNLKLQKDQFMALYEQSKKPDPEWARKLNKLNAVWHIGWNLPGHIAEVFQPMLSGVHELVAKGESLPGALKQFYKTEKEVAKVWGYRLKDKFFKPEDARFEVDGVKYEGLPALWLRVHGDSPENVNIAKMLHAKRDRIQKAPLSEIRNFTGEQHAKLQDVISGNRQRTLGEIIASPFTMYANAAMNFYSKFTQHNGIVTMVTAYRKFKKQGMTHEQAMDAAELFDLTVNNSGGRLERPEMFGKLGGAGHLPYGLTSYVRGRFSQLATYYRHGFETEAFSNLTPAERGNAKKAFQTMILAQLGAAGILGMPFVGAGIALMEELLGEDLKGKMINALDEVTNDPMLTRVFTHGMMSTMAESFGLPADLHSRFALSSFLGTNSYDGMSAKSFMGPSVAMLDSMFNLGGQVAKGESLEKALTVAGPGGVKRLAEALGEEYQRENPESNLLMSMLGFRSSQQVKKKEWEQITRKQELETRRKLEQSAMEISKALEAGPASGRKQLLIEAEKFLSKDLDYQQTVKQRQQNIKDLIQKVSMIEADKVGPQDVRREISGRLAPVASQTAQSMGVQMSNPMELARAITQQKTRSQLGATVSQRPVRNAMLQEMQWGNNPWEF